ncbi:MAG: tannase/feruloyl esterase family alpha/beta hydrolase [Acidobacteria bacterium]|nr:tannase/feruloyl esterase family alpha/beta hydrolase [Acidobacteriota bacterium]
MREGTAQSCSSLVGLSVPASQIGLATHGAKVASAEVEKLEDDRTICILKGAIAPVDPKAPDINFQINLPSKWNGNAVHRGGGGYDGVLVDGRHFHYRPRPPQRDLSGRVEGNGFIPQEVDITVQGNVTFGSDSGHQFDGNITRMAAFATNAEALENFGGAQLKKVHDVAIQMIWKYYGRAPSRIYFYGSSQGGHEGLTVAQRWPMDYDGVVSIHPAYNLTALQLSGLGIAQRLYRHPGAWLSPLKSTLIANAVLKTCDALDGLADGVIANVNACRAAFDVHKLVCPGGRDEGPECLSNAQIATAEFISGETTFGFSVSGITGFGGWPILEGAGTNGSGFGFGTKPVPDRPPAKGDAGVWIMADQLVRYMVIGDPTFDSLTFEPSQHIAAIQHISHLIDASSPDLDAFRWRGGKLLLMHGTVDMAIPPSNSIAYYERLRDRYGTGLKDFVRFYMAPGFGHGPGPFVVSWDSLTTLDRWVDSGQSPRPQTVQDVTPEHGGRSRPLCEYPLWPKYRGSGDPNAVESFVCTSDAGDR